MKVKLFPEFKMSVEVLFFFTGDISRIDGHFFSVGVSWKQYFTFQFSSTVILTQSDLTMNLWHAFRGWHFCRTIQWLNFCYRDHLLALNFTPVFLGSKLFNAISSNQFTYNKNFSIFLCTVFVRTFSLMFP